MFAFFNVTSYKISFEVDFNLYCNHSKLPTVKFCVNQVDKKTRRLRQFISLPNIT